MEEEKTLKKMAEAFKELADSLSQCPDGEEARLELGPFANACSLVSLFIGFFGSAFKHAELDYRSKVNDLVDASKSITVVPVMMDDDIKTNCVRRAGSHTRNLLRAKRGIDLVKVFFEHFISSEGNSLKNPVSKAYAQAFAPYHGWPIRKAVASGMYSLPTRARLLSKLNEDETSARIQMQIYIASAGPVVKYIDQLFISRGLGIDW